MAKVFILADCDFCADKTIIASSNYDALQALIFATGRSELQWGTEEEDGEERPYLPLIDEATDSVIGKIYEEGERDVFGLAEPFFAFEF